MAGQTYAVYWRMNITTLKRLRSEKVLMKMRLSKATGYYGKMDYARLMEQIRVIDVVIAQKADQLRLPE